MDARQLVSSLKLLARMYACKSAHLPVCMHLPMHMTMHLCMCVRIRRPASKQNPSIHPRMTMKTYMQTSIRPCMHAHAQCIFVNIPSYLTVTYLCIRRRCRVTYMQTCVGHLCQVNLGSGLHCHFRLRFHAPFLVTLVEEEPPADFAERLAAAGPLYLSSSVL